MEALVHLSLPRSRVARSCVLVVCSLLVLAAALGVWTSPVPRVQAASGPVTVCAPSSKTNWTSYSVGPNDPCTKKLYARTTLSGGAAGNVDYYFNSLSSGSYHIWVFVGDTYANAGNVHYHIDALNFSHGGYINQEAYTNQWVELSAYGASAYSPNNGTVHVSVDNQDTSSANQNCPSGNGICYVSADAIAVSTGGPPSVVLNDYPWNGLTYQNGGDRWGMAYGQCVSYAAWKIYENYGGRQHPPYVPDQGWMPSDYTISPVNYNWGNADAWANSARAAGIAVDHSPRVGDIAQWGDISGTFTVGHVAYVYQVNGDGSVELAQYNLRENSKYSTLHMPLAGAYDTSFGYPAFYVPFPQYFIHAGD